MMSPGRRAIFLDRDGTLMENVDYCGDPARVRVFPGVPRALERLRAAGYGLYMVTNQSGIGRGYFTEEDFERVQAECARQLLPASLDGAYHCPDAPERATGRRKPAAGMILEAVADHGIAPTHSYMVGDSVVDIECGRRAGVRGTVLIATGHVGAPPMNGQPDHIAADFAAAADWILAQPLL